MLELFCDTKMILGYFFHGKAKWRPSFDFCHINNHYNKIPNLNVSMIWETFESDF